MKTSRSIFSYVAIIMVSVCLLGSCELFTGPKGDEGSAGRDIYIDVKTPDTKVTNPDVAGTKIYSGGCLEIGAIASMGDLGDTATVELAIENKSGHGITLVSDAGKFIAPKLSSLTNWSVDENGIGNGTIAAQSSAVFKLIVTAQGDRGSQYYSISYVDNVNGSTGVFGFTAHYVIKK